MNDLSTTYLGLRLASPLVASASPLAHDLGTIRRMEDAGAAGVVLPSLFEEQIADELDGFLTHGTYWYPEPGTYLPEPEAFLSGPNQYLEHVRRARKAVGIPVIASLNGVSRGGWTSYARAIQQAGADALELNVYFLPTDPFLNSAEIEQEYVDLVREVVNSVSIPVAVKLNPFLTNLAGLCRRLDEAGARGFVLFNRFPQPDIDLDALEFVPQAPLSPARDPSALRLPLTWTGILYGRVKASLAASGGVHSAEDVIKLILVGADVTMVASALIRHGAGRLTTIREDLEEWMDQHEYASLRQIQGSLSQRSNPLPAVFERVSYVRAISSLRYLGKT
jgi:dihydroorotate dehydrogenase (fumarate)